MKRYKHYKKIKKKKTLTNITDRHGCNTVKRFAMNKITKGAEADRNALHKNNQVEKESICGIC